MSYPKTNALGPDLEMLTIDYPKAAAMNHGCLSLARMVGMDTPFFQLKFATVPLSWSCSVA
jgi:hypothetical protein